MMPFWQKQVIYSYLKNNFKKFLSKKINFECIHIKFYKSKN